MTRSAVVGASGRSWWARPVEFGPVGLIAGLAVLAATRPASEGPGPVSVLTDATRVVGYTGITLFIGTMAFWLLIWPSGRHDRGLIGVAWLGLTITAVSGLTGLATALAAANAGADLGADVGVMAGRPRRCWPGSCSAPRPYRGWCATPATARPATPQAYCCWSRWP